MINWSSLSSGITAAADYDASTLDDWAPEVTAERVESFEHAQASGLVATFVAEQRGQVVGYATLIPSTGELFALYVDEVAIVPSGTVGRTTSGKVQRAATRARYERGELVADALGA